MPTTDANKLRDGPVLRSILLFSAPITVANLAQQSYLLADSFVVGNYLGAGGLAAIGVSQPLFYLVNAVFLGVVSGFSIRLATLLGRGQRACLPAVAAALALFVGAWTVTCFVLVHFAGTPVLGLLGVSGGLARASEAYLTSLSWGFPGLFGIGALTAYHRGVGDSRSAMYFVVFSSLLNACLVWWLVGALGWGVEGAGAGTAIACTFSTLTWLLRTGFATHARHAWRSARTVLAQFGKSVRLGAPVGLQHVLLSLGISALTGLIAPFGASAIAAFTVASRLENFAALIFLDLSVGVTIFVAHNNAAQDRLRANRGLTQVLRACAVAATAVSVLVILTRNHLGPAFTADPATQHILNDYIVITYPFFMCYALMVVVHGYLNGIGRTTLPLICTIVSFLVVRIPLAWALSRPYGLTGIMWTVDIGWLAGLIYTAAAQRRASKPRHR